jgi:hypothetical protein
MSFHSGTDFRKKDFPELKLYGRDKFFRGFGCGNAGENAAGMRAWLVTRPRGSLVARNTTGIRPIACFVAARAPAVPQTAIPFGPRLVKNRPPPDQPIEGVT